MPDYQKAIIYCIKSINDDENNGDIVYYGSTTQTLNKRWSKHSDIKNIDNKKYVCKCSEILLKYGVENCKCEIIEQYPCNNIKELNEREQYYIQNNECVNRQFSKTLEDIKNRQKKYYNDNKDIILYKTKEYNDENKDNISKQKKIYYSTNKDNISEQRKQYYIKNKEKLDKQINEYYNKNKEKIKQQKKEYYKNNKDKIAQQKKDYREKNRCVINEKRREYYKKHEKIKI